MGYLGTKDNKKALERRLNRMLLTAVYDFFFMLYPDFLKDSQFEKFRKLGSTTKGARRKWESFEPVKHPEYDEILECLQHIEQTPVNDRYQDLRTLLWTGQEELNFTRIILRRCLLMQSSTYLI